MNKDSLEVIKSYYSQPREEGKKIYEIWEEGKAYNDSVTPTTYDAEYREFITRTIESLLAGDRDKKMLSIGSGNAFVESDLHQKGYSVTVNDVNQDAIAIAQQKGLTAIEADVYEWEPQSKDFSLIYCDGVMGHLYEPEMGLKMIFKRLREWLLKDSVLLISNDAATTDAPVHPHPRVKGFYWFSADYLKSELLNVGYQAVETKSFFYNRPLTGKKERLIAIAKT
ncbi:class I SAM-dependent methyltransferase [Spirulina sp. 06S082]|uniref:class I SAM-dependent methyltransferase n=1 Tax=Spirulina sp. 06S082 TaxID=3110248 RepID=UPI002B1F5A8D|nr:methyltransferase domain-containing protein [Spirulina sp. 06S082]MEA5468849.1 methyltransferase domain-containing protein [Spirulina sp. 06S082]